MLPRQLLVTATNHSQYTVVLRTVVIESVEALGTRQGNQKNGCRASAHPDRAASKGRRLCTNERHGKTCGCSWYNREVLGVFVWCDYHWGCVRLALTVPVHPVPVVVISLSVGVWE